MSYRSFKSDYRPSVSIGVHTDEQRQTVCLTFGTLGMDLYAHLNRADMTRLLIAVRLSLADMNQGREVADEVLEAAALDYVAS